MKTARIALVLPLLLLFLVGCPGEDTSRGFSEVLSRCANSDAVENVLFFGFSNTIGPGAIWRNTADNGYLAVRPMPDFEGRENLFQVGASNACSGEAVRFTGLGGDVSAALGPILPASLGVDVSSADAVELSTGDWRWEELWVGLFADWVGQQPAENGYRGDLDRDRLVAGRALRVDGYEARFEFTDTVGAQVRAPIPSRLAEVGLSADWIDGRTLQVSSAEPAYVAVQMYRWDPMDGLSASEQLTEIVLDENAHFAGSAPGESR